FAGGGAPRGRARAEPLGAVALRRIPHSGGGVAAPLCRLDFSGCARLGVDPHRGSVGHRAVWSRPSRPGLAIAPLCTPARIRALGHPDRKSTRLNSSHVAISYAVFCLKKKKIDV